MNQLIINPFLVLSSLAVPRTIWAWGDNSPEGALGDGTVIDRSSPVQVGVDTDWTVVSGGTAHTHGVKNNGTLWSWGNSSNGRLGDGQTAINFSSPIQIGADTDWSSINAGLLHTMAIKVNGTMWGWGQQDVNDSRLGDGTEIARSSPVQIGADTDWLQVSAGGLGGMAIKTDGTLWGWGSGGSGRLGLGNTINYSSPVQIGALTDWFCIAHSSQGWGLALKTDGTIWSWGINAWGNLGQGNVVNLSSPVQIGVDTDWAKIAAGEKHALAVKVDGTLYSWGSSAQGQLGHGDLTSHSSPVQVGLLSDWDKISADEWQSLAIKTDKTLWVWGNNTVPDGILGDGTIIDRSSPVQIGLSTNWAEVSAGKNHSMALENA